MAIPIYFYNINMYCVFAVETFNILGERQLKDLIMQEKILLSNLFTHQDR